MTPEIHRSSFAIVVFSEKGRKTPTPVTAKIAERIRKWAKPEFDMAVLSYPLGLCSVCRVRLAECEHFGTNNLPNRPDTKEKWDAFQLQNIHIPRGQMATTCTCDICVAGQKD